jgi:exodeoxyribonuclease VIII
MIDLETLGTRVSSVFLSIGAVQFDLETGKTGKQFYAKVNLESAMRKGLTLDAHTIQWWMTQDKEARAEMFEGSRELHHVLIMFANFVNDIMVEETSDEPLCFWGNSASFDLGILGHAYDACEMDRPWNFRYERCYRTLIALWPRSPQPAKDGKEEDMHVAIKDSLFQVERLCLAWQYINSNRRVYEDLQDKYDKLIAKDKGDFEQDQSGIVNLD